MLGSRDNTTQHCYDLQELLGEGARCSGTYINAKDLNRPDFHLLIEKKFTAFPDNLLKHFDQVQCRRYMGLFPELRRVWVAIDNVLYLWDYEISEFEIACELSHVITAVGLVKPPEGLFLDEVHYLMIICTVSTVYLFSVETEQRLLLKRFSVKLKDVQYELAADGASFRCIVGTSEGRIFLGGQDGHIYELQYPATTSFLANRRKIRKKNHTKSILEVFAPSFMLKLASFFSRSFTEDPLLNLVHDDERHWLYAHHESDCIQVFNVAQQFEAGPYIVDIASLVSNICVANPNTDRRALKIISLHPIHSSESKHLCLVAITDISCRLYFSVQCHMGTRSPSSIKLEYVRLPPVRDLPQSLAQPQKPLDIHVTHPITDLRLPLAHFSANTHTALYARGVMLSANALSGTGDALLCTAMDSWMVRPPGMDGSSKEKTHVMHLDGRTWDLREIDSATAMPITQIDSEENKPRHFLWLGSEGIRVLCKQRPLDELIYLLRSEVRDIKYFVDVYGQDQVCAWLLAILCQNIGQVHPSLMPQDIGFHSHLVKRHFFFYGGSPVRQPVTSHQTVLGTSVVPSTLQHSGCYRGLDLYVKRLIAPYWKKTLFKKLSSYQYALAIPEHLFQTAQRELAKLIQFTEEWHPPPSDSSMFTERSTHVSVGSGGPLESRGGGSVTGNAGGGGGSLSWYQEKPYLLELFQFIQLTYEAVRFVLILIRMRLPDIASNLPASQKLIPDELATQPFEFLVTEQGRQFCGQIATFLVQHAALYYPTESLSPQFRDMCPHLLPVDDIYTAMVLEKLDNLGTLNIPVCEEALSIVLNVAGKLKLRQFTIITEKFTKLGFARGVLDLALRRAMEIDLEDRAVAYVEEGQPDQDPRRVLVKQRYECYYAILNALDTLNQLLEKEPTPILESHRASSHAQALESKDKLWHFALYEWYTRTNLASVLDLKTLYLEDWLNSPPVWEKANDLTKTEASSCLSLYEKQKLLAQYYVIQKKFENASLVLFNLATVPSDQLTLEERIYFLKEASQTVRACNHTELQKKIRDVLDVASVQQSLMNQLRSPYLSLTALSDLQTLYLVAEEHGLVPYQLRLLAMSEDPESLTVDTLVPLWHAVFDPFFSSDVFSSVTLAQVEAQFEEVLCGHGSGIVGSNVYAPSVWVSVVEDVSFQLHQLPDFFSDWWLRVAVGKCNLDIEAVFVALKTYFAQLPDIEYEKKKFVIHDMAHCLELWKKQLTPGFDSSVWESSRAIALNFAEQFGLSSEFYF